MLTYRTFQSPVGELTLVANARALTGVFFRHCKRSEVIQGSWIATSPTAPRNDESILLEAQQQLTEYFAGKRTQFDLPLEFTGTDFQKKVWAALLEIPYGQTKSYADIAKQVGLPKAVRAVGLANSKNPISIIAACHRVIGSRGKLTGYAGGLHNKKYLLELESAQMG